jgi:hypothetical protein
MPRRRSAPRAVARRGICNGAARAIVHGRSNDRQGVTATTQGLHEEHANPFIDLLSCSSWFNLSLVLDAK